MFYNKEELEELFDKACNYADFNFVNEICNEYLDNTISLDYLNDLNEKN